MGGMIACKLAALAPHRIHTCALISVTAGGAQVLPRKWKALKYAFKVGPCGCVCLATESGMSLWDVSRAYTAMELFMAAVEGQV